MARIIGIYKITSPNGKVYIGQSWNISRRWREHKKIPNENYILYNSFRKYGVKNHLFEIEYILPADSSQEVLNNYEIFFWLQYKNSGRNMMNIKEPGSNGKLPKESILKMIATKKLNPVPAWNKNIKGEQSHSFGRKHTEESIIKMMVNAEKGWQLFKKDEVRYKNWIEKNRVAKLGTKKSDVTKKKMSDAAKGKPKGPCSIEHKKNISKGKKGSIPWNKGMKGQLFGKNWSKRNLKKQNKYK